MQKITPFLWFDGQAEDAVNFYTSIFKNSSIENVSRLDADGSNGIGPVMSVSFVLDGEKFMALNGGPQFTFTPAISFFVHCETQAEVDDFWEKLSAGGEQQQCGWLQDKFGISWQIVPDALGELLNHDDDATSQRVMKAMLQMTKLDIDRLEAAAASA